LILESDKKRQNTKLRKLINAIIEYIAHDRILTLQNKEKGINNFTSPDFPPNIKKHTAAEVKKDQTHVK